jgi:hypothetical protein
MNRKMERNQIYEIQQMVLFQMLELEHIEKVYAGLCIVSEGKKLDNHTAWHAKQDYKMSPTNIHCSCSANSYPLHLTTSKLSRLSFYTHQLQYPERLHVVRTHMQDMHKAARAAQVWVARWMPVAFNNMLRSAWCDLRRTSVI